MRSHEKRRGTLPALLGLGALALGVLCAPPTGQGGGSALLAAMDPWGGGFRLGISFLMALCLGAAAVLFGFLLVTKLLSLGGKRRRPTERYAKPAKWSALGLLVLALGFWLIPQLSIRAFEATGIPSSPGTAAQGGPGQASPSPPAAETGDQEVFDQPSPWLLLAGGLAGLALAAAGLSLMAVRRARLPPGTVPADPSALAETAARAHRRLELGDPLRDTIVECYAAMLDIFADRAAARGIRAAVLTPREFAARLAGPTGLAVPGGPSGAGEAAVGRLTAIFERARYSGEACDEADRRGAMEALAVLADFAGAPGNSRHD